MKKIMAKITVLGMGAMAGLLPDAIAIASSTLTLAWTKELAQEFQAKNLAFVIGTARFLPTSLRLTQTNPSSQTST